MFGARHVLRNGAPQPAGENFSAAERHARFTQTILSRNKLDGEWKLLTPQPRSPCALLTGGGHKEVRRHPSLPVPTARIDSVHQPSIEVHVCSRPPGHALGCLPHLFK